MLSLDDLHTRIDTLYSANSQKHNEAMGALGALRAALEAMAKHGHRLAVVEDTPAVVDRFPLVLYKGALPPLQVENADEEADAIAAGWALHPSMVQAAADDPDWANDPQEPAPPAPPVVSLTPAHFPAGHVSPRAQPA